ncbi:MAG: PLP-dependent aminotransferase family protein [Polyangiaceae bacterium]|nr:PLP-dependent aminotransferase family protein [Polyangiaceae bacterium]
MKAGGFVLVVPEGDAPIFARIAGAVVADIRRGRLRPGDTLPGSRTLAAALGVHRNTVLAAERELALEGWIEATPGGTTRVCATLPESPPRARPAAAATRAESVGFELGPEPPAHVSPAPPGGAIKLLGGLPDLRMVPATALARAYRRVATSRRAHELFGYADPRGDELLRAELAAMLARSRALALEADDLVVTRGSQMALYLTALSVLRPGDRVAVEALGYRPAWSALQAAGAVLEPIPVDAGGLDVERLTERVERAARQGSPFRAVYLTPHHQYPTTAVLGQPRRLALLALARQRRLALFEDDYDHEFHYEGRPIAPLASADPSGQVIYLGTLSKILAPALRVGFVVAPRPLLSRLAALRAVIDRQGDRLVERALRELMTDGELERHARRMRRVYQGRRAALARALEEQLGDVVSFDVPRGGMALWARAPRVDVDRWASACEARGVVLQPGSRFSFTGERVPAVRLGFAAEAEPRLRRAVRLMAEALLGLGR